MQTFFEEVEKRLGRGEQVCLAVIVQQKGSTPRDAGTMMTVYADGSFSGTIGGGLAEAEVLQDARTLMSQGGLKRIFRSFSMTDGKSASSMGMVCGGEMGVQVSLLQPKDRSLFVRLLERLKAEQPCFLALPLGEEPVDSDVICLVDEERGVDTVDLSLVQGRTGNPPGPLTFIIQGREWFFCPVAGAPRVYFFGAGHVSRATAEVAALAGFDPIVVDDRKELTTPEFFPHARIHCLPSFHGCVSGFSLTSNDMVVIASRIPLLDNILLEQVLATPAGFVGMLGSVRKRDAIFADLLEKGVSKDTLERVHCPLGLSIGARTPQEIGISIVAQLIAARRKGV